MAAGSGMQTVKTYFGMTMAEFRAEWKALSDDDKAEIIALVEAEAA